MRGSSPRRDKIEISAEILKKAREGVKKTNIMYECNLNFTQLGDYLNVLSGSGLLALMPNGQYITTPQGMDAMRKAEEARRAFSEVYKRLREK